jgi:hypothetical protein
MFRDTMLARRQREDDERAAKLAEQKDKAAKEAQRNNIYAKLVADNFTPTTVASEIADNIVHGKPMSKATEKWRSLKAQKLELQLAKLNGVVSGGTKDAKLVEEFENLKRGLYPARGRGDTTQENNIMRRIEAVGSKLQAKGYEVGYGDNPYVKPPQAQQRQLAAPQQAKTITRAEMQALGVTDAQAKAEGFTIVP